MYGTNAVLLANGYPIFLCRAHGVLDEKVDKIRRWRRRTEGTLGALLLWLKIKADDVPVEALLAPVDAVTYVWFELGTPVDRGGYKL